MTKLSVVTTVYNGEKYFDRAFPSIFNQTYTNFEWIIVDDGSTDLTANKLMDLQKSDQRIKVFQSERLGRAKALNYAIEKAQGEYIANQDFDDISYPERLKLQVEFLEAHPEVAIVGCNYIVNDENRQERYVRIPPTKHHQLVQTMAKCIPFAHTLVTFRKDAWIQSGGYPEIDDIEDLRLWITFVKLGWKLGSLPEELGEHWVHPKSFWHRNFEYSRRQKKLANIQWQAIRELNIPLWTGIYPLGRYVYCYSPKELKSFLRRVVAGSNEENL